MALSATSSVPPLPQPRVALPTSTGTQPTSVVPDPQLAYRVHLAQQRLHNLQAQINLDTEGLEQLVDAPDSGCVSEENFALSLAEATRLVSDLDGRHEQAVQAYISLSPSNWSTITAQAQVWNSGVRQRVAEARRLAILLRKHTQELGQDGFV